jgi:hypothetical protein
MIKPPRKLEWVELPTLPPKYAGEILCAGDYGLRVETIGPCSGGIILPEGTTHWAALVPTKVVSYQLVKYLFACGEHNDSVSASTVEKVVVDGERINTNTPYSGWLFEPTDEQLNEQFNTPGCTWDGVFGETLYAYDAITGDAKGELVPNDGPVLW